MNRLFRVGCLLAACCLTSHSISALEIETVPIGNPGADGPNSVGAQRPGVVDAVFHIGKYEVTNLQYAEFLNAVDPTGTDEFGLYHSNMATSPRGGIQRQTRNAVDGSRYRVLSGREDYPVVLVSWYDSARFTNWLHNGQGNGSTETGAYDLASHPLDRNEDARWFLPTRDEWVKAAYHSNNSEESFYFAYPTISDIAPTASLPTATPNRANIANVAGGPTPGGSYSGSPSPYGTFDQAGNMREWTGGLTPSGLAGIQGGSWFHSNTELNALYSEGMGMATLESTDIGFRVATSIPEPSSATMFLLASASFAILRRCGATLIS